MSKEIMLINLLFDDEESDVERALFSSSSSSSDSENDENLMYKMISMIEPRKAENRRPVENDYLERVIPGYTETEFKSHFRILPETFEFILDLIGTKISMTSLTSGRKPIPARTQLLLTLSIMSTPDSYQSVHKRFKVGKATAFRSVRRVSSALHELSSRFVTWPSGEKAKLIMQEFELKSGFPSVIGVIGDTRFTIESSKQDSQSNSDKNMENCIQVIAVCTPDLMFTSVFVGHAKCTSDAEKFKASRIKHFTENREIYFPNDSHLVGDSTYGINPHLMIPYENEKLTGRQRNFNHCLSLARKSIDRAFATWKCRWRGIFDRHSTTIVDRIPQYVIATCVLHNICVSRGDTFAISERKSRNSSREKVSGDDSASDCEKKRDAIMNNLPMKIS